MKSAEQILRETVPTITFYKLIGTPIQQVISAVESYASQSAGQGSEGGYSEADLYEAYNDGCNEGMSAAGAFEWGTKRKDISSKSYT